MKTLSQTALLSAEMHPDKVGIRVAALRESLRLSKAQFADSLNFDRSTLSKIEQGARGLDIAVAARIAELYGAGLDFIYRGQIADVPLELRTSVLNIMHGLWAERALPSIAKENP